MFISLSPKREINVNSDVFNEFLFFNSMYMFSRVLLDYIKKTVLSSLVAVESYIQDSHIPKRSSSLCFL